MKRLLFTCLILSSTVEALPKNAMANLLAGVGLSSLAIYCASLLKPAYQMEKKPMVNKKVNGAENVSALQFKGYHIAVNADNDIYHYHLLSSQVNLAEAAREIGFAHVMCSQDAKKQRKCYLAELHINAAQRYKGLGSLLLQETLADVKQRTKAKEVNLFASAAPGTDQKKLEHFYEKNGGCQIRKQPVEFVFNLRDNKI